uniref:Uncharacterized protein n=1 Tax=Anopheles albimanus TaxID=7167 RepID=A0A182F1V4_ANOAL
MAASANCFVFRVRYVLVASSKIILPHSKTLEPRYATGNLFRAKRVLSILCELFAMVRATPSPSSMSVSWCNLLFPFSRTHHAAWTELKGEESTIIFRIAHTIIEVIGRRASQNTRTMTMATGSRPRQGTARLHSIY